MYTIEEFDKQKTKVLKVFCIKKESIYEVKQKFKREINEELLDEIIQNLEENNYLNDEIYIRKSYI